MLSYLGTFRGVVCFIMIFFDKSKPVKSIKEKEMDAVIETEKGK